MTILGISTIEDQQELVAKVNSALTEPPADGAVYGRRGLGSVWVQVMPVGMTINWDLVTGKPLTFPPTLPIAQSDVTGLVAALAGKEPAFAIGDPAYFLRGNKTWTPIDKNTVGLSNVDNTSDANKPVSSATATALNLRVLKAGDIMTGGLDLAYANPVLRLTKTASGQSAAIVGRTSGAATNPRWVIQLGNGAAEGGSNAGSDFSIDNYSDGGVYLGSPIVINRARGTVMVNASLPTAGAAQLVSSSLSTNGTLGMNAYINTAGTAWQALITGFPGAFAFAPTNGAFYWYAAPSTGPGGAAPLAQKMVLDYSGNLTTTGQITTAQNFLSSVGAVVLAPSGAVGGVIYLRPNGAGNAGGQSTIDTNGTLSVNGAISSTSSIYAAGQITYNGRLQTQTFADTVIGSNGSTMYFRPWGTGSTSGEATLDNTGKLSAMLFSPNGSAGANSGFQTRNSVAVTAHTFNLDWNAAGPSGLDFWVDNGLVGNLFSPSDYRVKKDVVDLTSKWDVVKALRPIKYTPAQFAPSGSDPAHPLFAASDTEMWGFIADELQTAMIPSAATGTKDGPNIQSPNLLALLAAVTRALQEAMTRIEALEAA